MIKIEIFTTKGAVDIPLNEVPISNYLIKFGNSDGDIYKAVINNINVIARTEYVLNGR